MCVKYIKLTDALTRRIFFLIFQKKMIVVLACLCKICHHNSQDVTKVAVLIALLCLKHYKVFHSIQWSLSEHKTDGAKATNAEFKDLLL